MTDSMPVSQDVLLENLRRMAESLSHPNQQINIQCHDALPSTQHQQQKLPVQVSSVPVMEQQVSSTCSSSRAEDIIRKSSLLGGNINTPNFKNLVDKDNLHAVRRTVDTNMNGTIGMSSGPSSEGEDDDDENFVYDDEFDDEYDNEDDNIHSENDNNTKYNESESQKISSSIDNVNNPKRANMCDYDKHFVDNDSVVYNSENKNIDYTKNTNITSAATIATTIKPDINNSQLTSNISTIATSSAITSSAIHHNTANNTTLSATFPPVVIVSNSAKASSVVTNVVSLPGLPPGNCTKLKQPLKNIEGIISPNNNITAGNKNKSSEDRSNLDKNNDDSEEEMICSECGTEFTDVQSYMSHGCVQSSEESNDYAKNSSNATAVVIHSRDKYAEGCNDERDTAMDISTEIIGDIPSDAESFEGKIVYNTDGSAYIIEGGESDFSETESLLDVPNKEGIIIDQKGKFNAAQQVPSFPQIASAFYIQKNPAFYNAWYSMLPPESRPRSEAPIMHSYRVFDVRSKTDSEIQDESGSPKSAKAVDLKSGDITSVPTKPILMCFICKLSFGYAKSFVTHSLTEHSMNLNDEEKSYLSRKNASAIIQGVGKSKDPLMSFLEPVCPPLNKSNSLICKGFLDTKQKSSSSSATNSTNVSFVYSGSKVTPVEQKSSTSSMELNTSPKSLNNLQKTVMSLGGPHSYRDTNFANKVNQKELVESRGMDIDEDNDDSLSSNDNLHNSIDSSFTLKSSLSSFNHRGMHLSGLGGYYDSGSPIRKDIASSHNYSINSSSKLYQSPSNRSNSNSPGSSSGPPPLTSPQPGLSSSTPTSLSPKISLPNIPVPPLVPVSSNAAVGGLSSVIGTVVNPNAPVQGIVIRAGCEDHPNGNISGEECLKCESVLGTARHQLGNQMTMMHSRNSCKTLKCPKCNWHYKYQETLEIHMKEKHPENDTQCIYCITKQPHPRLARGEVYTCGYKPYRCEVCNYSTTTKGNLSIHMQSDKHINNMQELQKAQSGGVSVGGVTNGPQTPTTPNGGHMNHISPISSGSIEVQIPPTTPPVCSTPVRESGVSLKSSSTMVGVNRDTGGIELKNNSAAAIAAVSASSSKPKPSWRCDVCNYETNVARNLRIHMTSEKHTHNMMMLQQNVKHMQRDMHFQLNQMAFIGQDPGMIFGLPSPLGPGLQPFPFDPNMLMAPGMPNPLSATDGPMDLTKPDADPSIMNTSSMDFKNNNEPSKLFHCAICEGYSADSLESLHSHMQLDRTKHGNEEHVTVINGTYICNLCQYKTNLKANFQLHCKTDKHLQRLQLVNHIREGCRNTKDSSSNEWQMKYFANISNPVQVRCNACNYYTNSIHKLQLHNSTPRHEGNAKLFHHLQQREGDVSGEKKYYLCNLCKANSKSKLGLIEHVKSMTHMRNESIKILQLQELGKEIELNAETIFLVKELHEDDDLKFEEDIRPLVSCDSELSPPDLGFPRGNLPNELFSLPLSSSSAANVAMHLPSVQTSLKDETKDHTREKLYSCQYCKFSSASEERLDSHIKSAHYNSEGSSPKDMACPLCQEKYAERSKIENHLVEVHNVSKEGLQRLMIIFDSHPSNSNAGGSSTIPTLTNSGGKIKSATSTSSCSTVVSSLSSNANSHYLSSNVSHSSPPTLISAPIMLNGPTVTMVRSHSRSPSVGGGGGTAAETISKPPQTPPNMSATATSALALNRIMDMRMPPGNLSSDEQMMVDDSDPVAEMMENHALMLAEEASKDGIVLSDSSNKDGDKDLLQFRCQTCTKTFQNIDSLYNHQNELGHLELKQTPRGPGYLCWKKGCNQYFTTAQSLQIHFREIHAKKPISSSNMSVSEKHAYKYRCKQCSLAFKTVEKLQMHSYYHIIRNATMCFMCSKQFRTIAAMRKHMEATHLDTMTVPEKEKYAQNLTATAPLAYLGIPGMENAAFPAVSAQNSALQALQAFQQGLPMSLPMPSFLGMPNMSMSGFLTQQASSLKAAGLPSLESPGKFEKDDSPSNRTGTPGSTKSNELKNTPSEDGSIEEGDDSSKDSFVDESLNTIALAENSFIDPSKKYKCLRCKVAFAKQSLLIQHNKTLSHKGKISSCGIGNNNYKEQLKTNFNDETQSSLKQLDMNDVEIKEKLYNDPSRPYKCEYCEESFIDRATLQVHLSSSTHFNTLKRLRQNKENNERRMDFETSAIQLHESNNKSTKENPMTVITKEGLPADNKLGSEVTKPSSTQTSRKDPNLSTSVASLTPNKSSSSHGDKVRNLPSSDNNKAYKCNICKVAYNQSGTLDAHLNSAVHQAKASKIEELIIAGEVDMTQPLIEKPDITPQFNLSSQEQNIAVLHELMKQTALGGLPPMFFSQAAAASGFMGGLPGFMGLQVPPAGFFPNMSLPNAVVSNSFNASSASTSSSSFPSGMGLMISNNNNKKLESSIYTMADNTKKNNVIATSNTTSAYKDVMLKSNNVISSTGNSLIQTQIKSKSIPASPVSKSEKSGGFGEKDIVTSASESFICEKCNGQYNTAENLVQHQQMYCLMQMTSLRMKLHAQRGLLENIGFECVMQYNENNQRSNRKKKSAVNSDEKKLINGSDNKMEESNKMDVDEKEALVVPGSIMWKDKNGNEKELPGSNNRRKSDIIPELEKMVCPTCTKEFSSVWVLKTHQEEVHKDIISTDFVSLIADKFREMFDEKYPQGIISDNCNMDVSALVEASAGSNNSSVCKDAVQSQGTIKQEEPQVSKLGADLASAQAAQMMQMPMFNMLSGMMPMPLSLPVGMNMAPPMMPMMMSMGPNPNEMMGLPGMQMLDPNMMNSQTQNSPANHQAAAAAAAAAAAQANNLAAQQQQQKRGRTRISDDQLKVLRNHFDINNSPTEEQIMKMSEQTGLPPKVIKHWFRNTLFKERQRNKDSPYNFSVPPSTQLNLEEYEKTGTWKSNLPTAIPQLPQLQQLQDNCATTTNTVNTTTTIPMLQPCSTPTSSSSTTTTSATNAYNSKVSVSQSSTLSLDQLPKEQTKPDEQPNIFDELPKPIVIIPEKLKDIPDMPTNNNNSILPTLSPVNDVIKTEDKKEKELITAPTGENLTSSKASPPRPSSVPALVSASLPSGLPVNNSNDGSSRRTDLVPSSMPALITATNGSTANISPLSNNALMNSFNPVSMGQGFPPLMSPINPFAANHMELSMAFAKALANSSGGLTVNTPEKMATADMKLMSPEFRRMSSSDGGPEVTSSASSVMTSSTPGQSPNNAANFLSSRRANRTRFSDYQLKLLQEYFEQNAYPKDDDLDHLSKLLNLSPRVIVVWFQNARQKARKSYENNPPTSLTQAEDDSKYNRTPGLNYQCKRCFTVFQRYYELIRHQKTRCYKDEDDERSETNLSTYQDDDSMSDDDSKAMTPGPSQSLSHSFSKDLPPMSTTPKSDSSEKGPAQYECEKCTAVFPRFDLWNEHQKFHLLNPSLMAQGLAGMALPQGNNEAAMAAAAAAAAAGMNPFSSFPPILPALPTAQQIHAHLASIKHEDMLSAKRKYEEDEYDRDENGQKRMRTTILPEQLDYLYQQYQLDCNPSRRQLEAIADHVGLKKRVVQVWFQNTRARERKGQYRAHTQLIHKRCPFCRALFRAKSALESHLAAKHPEEMARTQVNIDAIPDEPIDSLGGSSEGGSAPTTPTPNSVPNLDMAKLLNNPYNMPNQFMPIMSASPDDPLQASMKQLYEESLRRYMADVTGVKDEKSDRRSGGGRDSEESPLDLSKPVDLSRSYNIKDDNDDFLTDNESDDDNVQISMTDSGPASPSSTTSSTHTPSTMTSPNDKNNQLNIPPKRYRTQLSALQVKIMKSIYQYYKTPTMTECELLGRQIGLLTKRVIQVWFQNARAKEKKAKSQYPNYSPELDIPTPPEECKLCNFKYSHQYTIQDHLFSRRHVDNVTAHIRATDHEVANETSRSVWEKNEAAAMAQMNVQAAALQQSMSGLAAVGSSKKKDNDEGKQIIKNSKNEKHTAKKPEANSSLGLPPGSATSSVAALMNPFSGLMAAGMPPGMMEMGAAAMAAQATAGMFPFMMPPNHAGSGGVMPSNPGAAMGLPFMPPGLMPGPEMFLYDPTTFGTPLTLLQIPPAAIKSVQSKLQDEGCVITRYTQDCKNLVDLKSMISSGDFACASETMVDVGYICRKCQMVYPGKEACINHQQMVCYQGKTGAISQDRTIIKLEQIQLECKVCDMKFSTLQEYQVHCDMDMHKQKIKKR